MAKLNTDIREFEFESVSIDPMSPSKDYWLANFASSAANAKKIDSSKCRVLSLSGNVSVMGPDDEELIPVSWRAPVSFYREQKLLSPRVFLLSNYSPAISFGDYFIESDSLVAGGGIFLYLPNTGFVANISLVYLHLYVLVEPLV